LLSGVIAELTALPLVWFSGALRELARSLGSTTWLALVIHVCLMTLAGALYGKIFMRAANDRRGGWLFGISFGFLLWMLGPVTILQWLLRRPAVIGVASIGLFAAQVLFGLLLGLLFPWIHSLIQRRTARL
jgi:hypothetical protein